MPTFFAIVALFLSTSPARALTLPEFQEKMRGHVDELSKNTTVSVRIELLGKDQVLFSRDDEKALIPASGAKVLTTVAALEKLGPGYVFSTRVLRAGDDLTIVSNGDPYLVSERLWLLAREVARGGLKKVGQIKVGVGAYAETYRGLTEFEDSGEPFTALVSPTALNFNSLEIHVVPGPGAHPAVESGPVPSAYAEIKNEVSQTGGAGHAVTVKSLGLAENGKERFAVSGSIGRSSAPVVVYGIVAQPEAHIAAVFAALLRREGVSVAKDFGGVISEPEPGGLVVAEQDSLPLQDLVRLYNTYSNNFMAEEVFQALGGSGGAPASLAKSKQAMAEFFARHPGCKESAMMNGSGLSWDTHVSARCFTETIAFAYRDFRAFADLLGSLPAGGQTGTLKSRFKRSGGGFEAGKVRGKTGTLWSKRLATSLTGITSAASGEKVIFSLIENDQRNDPGLLRGLKGWEDQCVELVQQLRL